MKNPLSSRVVARNVVTRLVVGFLVATAVATVVAQTPFNSTLERQLWKKLLPMGDDLAVAGPAFVPVPRRVSVNVPSSVSKVPSYVDEFGNTIYKSSTDPWLEPGDAAQKAASAYIKERDLLMAATLADPVNNLHVNDGECTYSHLDDYDNAGPQWRQCKAGLNMVPPPPGALLDPVGIAVDGDTVYVVDDFNSRVQAYDFDGRVKPMQFPIGNGIPGIGPYSYASLTPAYRPYATFPGYETFNGGYSGSKVNAPNGIAVDAAHNIILADSGNHRIAVFNNIGQELFDFALPDHLGTQFKPTLVAITPGATVLPPGSTIPPGHESDRIVVTDWAHCFVRIYKANFEEVRSLPANFPAVAMHDACLNPGDANDPNFPPVNSGPGEFSTVTGAIVDDLGHIYITDHAQSVVQVFNVNGDTVGRIGKPGVQPAPGEINGPVGLAFDHRHRLGVIDGGNSRVVFYSLQFDPQTDAPTATFEFQLDVTVSVQDFPMGLAEQVGSGPGLDPKGRFLATDPFNRRVLRFELPELGIADAQAPFLDPAPVGTPAGTQVGHGTFKVLVPKQKLASVKKVEVTVVPVEPDVTITPGSIKPIDPALAGPPQILPNIAPGEYVSYEFYYTAPDSVRKATFKIDAKGDFDSATGIYKAIAPQGEAQSRATCGALCDATHQVYWLDQDSHPGLASTIHNNVTGDWYPDRVFVRVTPEPIDADVAAIGWYYGGNAAVFYPQKGDTQETALPTSRQIDIPFGVDGASQLYYWAISSDGSIGSTHVVNLNIDLQPPTGTFVLWPPYTGTPDAVGARWFNRPVTAGYNVSDALSGTDADVNVPLTTPDGLVQFTAEGRNQFTTVTVVDRVARATVLNSALSNGGRYVNIDTVAPQFDTDPTDIVVTVTGEDAQGSYAIIHPDAFVITATDPLLSNGEPGSGVNGQVSNPGGHLFRYGVPNQWTYTVVDHAGNVNSKTVNVTVRQASSGLGAPDQVVGYGGRVILRANVTPRTATGTVTFNWGPYSIPVPVQTVSGGIDPATNQLRVQGEAVAAVDPVLANVGVYPMHVTYSGDELNASAVYDLATVTVTPRTVTIAADGKLKYYGDPDPAFTYAIAGLINNDTADVQLTRVPGTAVGDYPIQLQSVTVSPNYTPVFEGAAMRIVGRITVTARNQAITYGDPDPAFTFDYSTLPEGAVVLQPPTCTVSTAHTQAGTYPITCSGAAGNFLQFSYVPSTLTVNKRPATLVAGSDTKLFGSVDPVLTTTQTGILAADLAGITLKTTRAAGESVGSYVTTPSATGGASSNYLFSITTGLFTITSATPMVSVTGGTYAYDALAHPAVCTVYGVGGAILPSTLTYSPGPGAPVNPGTYTATCSFAGDTNYPPMSGTATVTITKATPKANVVGGTFTYDQAAHGGSCTVTGVNGAALVGTLTYTPGPSAPVNAGTSTVSCSFAGDTFYNPVTAGPATIVINPRPIAVAAQPKQKVVGATDPALTYVVTSGSLLAGDTFSGALVRDAGETVGVYAIRQGTLTAGPNYALTFTNSTLTIVAANNPPDAIDDAATVSGITVIPVLANDRDPDGDALTITAVTQPPTTAGTVTFTGTQVTFTPVVGFTGTATFTYTISDGKGGTDTATVTVTVVGACNLAGYTTYTQGGWGANPTGNNPAALLASKFATVYPLGYVRIGGARTLTFTSAAAINVFLPAGGTASTLSASATNPVTSSAGVFAGQVLALQLSVDFSRAGVTKFGLGDLLYQGQVSGLPGEHDSRRGQPGARRRPVGAQRDGPERG